MTDLRTAAQQALEAWDGGDAEWFKRAYSVMEALRAALAEPVQEPVECEPQYANEDGWCEWVCPKPVGYLMQCCDCGLIHEVESRVAKYEPLPSEMFEVVDDPDLQAQWRMKRRDDISPKQAPQRPAEPQEPVLQALADADRVMGHDDEATEWRERWAHLFSCALTNGGYQCSCGASQKVHRPAPPQRKPLTDEEIFAIENDIPDDVIGDRAWTICFARAIERVHGIGGQP